MVTRRRFNACADIPCSGDIGYRSKPFEKLSPDLCKYLIGVDFSSESTFLYFYAPKICDQDLMVLSNVLLNFIYKNKFIQEYYM